MLPTVFVNTWNGSLTINNASLCSSTAGIWFHVAFRLNGNSNALRLFINGTIFPYSGVKVVSPNSYASTITFGGSLSQPYTPTAYVYIDEVRLSTAVVPDADIMALATNRSKLVNFS